MEENEDIQRKKKKKKKKKKILHSSENAPAPKKSEPPSAAGVSTGDPEIDGMLKRIRDMDQDLRDKMQRICDLSGMTKKEIENYLDNPSNFSELEWTRVQRDKEALENKIYSSIGLRTKQIIMKKKKKKMSKGRKGKTLGSRKGWLQM